MLQDDEFDYISGLIKDMTGNIIEKNKAYSISNKLVEFIKKSDYKDISELIKHLQTSHSLKTKQEVADVLTINETLFFRDNHPFETLKKHIIPELIERKRDERKLSFWSAACSSGQEIYSLIIMLKENFPEIFGWELSFLATDYSKRIIQTAQQARYTDMEVNRGMPQKLRDTYFHHVDDAWELSKNIKNLVQFKQMNLKTAMPIFDKYDIVLLRNVLIYFDITTKSEILYRIRKHMDDKGYLMLGSSETLIKIDSPFKLEKIGETMIYTPN